MRRGSLVVVIALLCGATMPAQPRTKGVRLEMHTWVEAQALLHPDAVVVIPVGAALKEHGPHLKLRNDLILAEYFTDRVLAGADVVVTAPLAYHFYPAFMEYPGSTTLTLETARDVTVQVVRSLARFGPRRFYLLNTGISTARPLQAAATALQADGILMRYTDFGAAVDHASSRIRQQEGGSHADEIETSMMLHIAPATVDMTKAVRDFSPPSTPMRLTRQQGAAGTYSPTGIWGNPTLATASKGKIIVSGVVERMLEDVAALRAATPPDPQPPAPPPAPQPPPAPAAAPAPRQPAPQPEGCAAGDERRLRELAMKYNAAWVLMDASALANFWALQGDIVHPDGSTERGREAIRINRTDQFMRKEYRASRHILTFGNVRCLTADVAVIDGKWEFRGVVDQAGRATPSSTGLLTLAMKRWAEGGWLIEAFRYTMNPQGTVPPTLLKKPGYPDKM